MKSETENLKLEVDRLREQNESLQIQIASNESGQNKYSADVSLQKAETAKLRGQVSRLNIETESLRAEAEELRRENNLYLSRDLEREEATNRWANFHLNSCILPLNFLFRWEQKWRESESLRKKLEDQVVKKSL